MNEENVTPTPENEEDKAFPDIQIVDSATEKETQERECIRRKEEEKHHSQLGS